MQLAKDVAQQALDARRLNDSLPEGEPAVVIADMLARDAGSLPKVDRFAGTNDDDWKGNPGRLGASECGEVLTASRSPIKTKLQMKIDSETQVIEEGEFKSFAWGLAAIASSSLPTEWVKGKSSRKRLPSRTRISSASSAFPHATLLDATRHSRIGRRLHLVGSPIF